MHRYNHGHGHHHNVHLAVKLTGILYIHMKRSRRHRPDAGGEYFGEYINMTSFNLFSNQRGTLAVTPVDGDGVARVGTGFRITHAPASTDVVTVTTNPGFDNQFPVTCHGAGTDTIGVSFEDEEGTTHETTFTFNVAAVPEDLAVKLDGEMQNVVVV